MSMGNNSDSFLGSVKVFTTSHRGYTPEEIADRAIDRIISVGTNSHPAIVAQAHEFKAHIYQVLVEYLTEAQQSERITICAKLDQQGFEEIANVIRRL